MPLEQNTVFDTDDLFPWEQITTTTDTDTGEITNRETVFDDGVQRLEEFENGIRTTLTQFDNLDARAWSEIYRYYDPSGELIYRETIFDDGVEKLERIENGALVTMTQFDSSNAKTWSEINTSYDQSGVVTFRETIYDDGVQNLLEFENGTRTTLTQFDNLDAKPWGEIKTYYDATGNTERREITYDDGVNRLEEYENGVRTLLYQEDPDDGQGGARNWQEKLNTYDTESQLLSAGTLFDDGDTIVFNYENGERTERIRVDGDDDQSWLLSVTTYTDMGPETVNYATPEEVPMEYSEYLDMFLG